MKADAPPLLPAGIHHLTSFALKQLAVDAFPADRRRVELFAKFLAWRKELRATGISARAWLDGSFLTEKAGPADIDLVVFLPTGMGALTQQQQARLRELLDHATVRAVYELDIYPVDALDPQFDVAESYWRGWFGFCRDRRTAKGIAEVVI
jgi:hypothetical protein